MEELWKPIPDFDGMYEISNMGRVKSCKRTRKSKAGSISNVQERILKQRSDKNGYRAVDLCKDVKLHYFRCYRLVADAFIPNPNHFPVINHKDEDVTNNVVSNLEWCSVSYNTSYSVHKRSQKVLFDGVEFPSIRSLARHLNADTKALRYRLKVGGLYKGKHTIISL
jgi:hypothetical protein